MIVGALGSVKSVDDRDAGRKLSYAAISTNREFQDAVTAWCNDAAAAAIIYGNISTWDTSLVPDMSYLFAVGEGGTGGYCETYETFNDDISLWDGKVAGVVVVVVVVVGSE